ncbi:protein PIN-LIKES 1-like isoform X2 [Nicotiana tabacum]|uniref:Protein PIN-LIKES 1-like isoform X2 n=1 Tax=Nicotiana tabacum TaxID=4097 RepID=A0A1S4CBM2_TOBAC|nr:PREDICTED: uncharacterized protein LOC107817222 isoform X2 [Nicotiana tabacum]
MSIEELFLLALMPVLKTLLIAVVGLFLALDRISILTAEARHHLNNLVFYIFFPAICASGVIGSSTETGIFSLWFIPVSILITFLFGSALGWILVKITRAPRHLHGLVIGCCAGGNMGNLPVIIIPAICAEKNNPFGDPSTCSKNGMGYVTLSMGIGAIGIWSFVYKIIWAYGKRDDRDVSVYSKLRENQHGETSKESLDSITRALLPNSNSNSKYDEASAMVETKVSIPVIIEKKVKSLLEYVDLSVVFRPPTIATGCSNSIHDYNNGRKSSKGFQAIRSWYLASYWDHCCSIRFLAYHWCWCYYSCKKSRHCRIRSFISFCYSAAICSSTCNGHRYYHTVV